MIELEIEGIRTFSSWEWHQTSGYPIPPNYVLTEILQKDCNGSAIRAKFKLITEESNDSLHNLM